MTDAPSSSSTDLLHRVRFAFLAAGFAWFALLSWSGLIEQPGRVFGPAWVGAIAIASVGAVLRWRRIRWYLVLLTQVVGLVIWLQARTSAHAGLRAWLPTLSGLRRLVSTVHQGAVEVDRYASPIATAQAAAATYFLVLGLLVVLSVDLFAGGLRQAPWAAMPVVVALAVPVSVLDDGLPWVEFCGCALLFVMLLASDELQRVRAWSNAGANPTPASRPDTPWPRTAAPVHGAAAGLGVLATFGALVLPVLVPVGGGLLRDGHGLGHGRSGSSITLVNPVVDLHRDLVQGGQEPLVIATTEDPDRTYLRLTVLDSFDGTQWQPSQRSLVDANRVHGLLPAPPGLDLDTSTTSSQWSLQYTAAFESAWLATPYPLQSLVTSGGDWRFDSRTLDFVRVDHQRLPPVSYQLTTREPVIDEAALAAAAPPPAAIERPMTALPAGMSPLIREKALQVTAGATTDYDRMVRLQQWFRFSGGFTYSTVPDSGNSADALVRFITTDKVGFCEQFAAAMATMARALGIPARVVVGFLHPDSLRNGQATYTADDLHAWPEVFFAGTGWVRFEPTPAARTGPAPSWTVKQTTSAPTPTVRPTARPTRSLPHKQLEVPDAARPTAAPGGSHGNRLLLVFGLIVLVALGLPALLRRRTRHRRLVSGAAVPYGEAAAAAWTELLATATDLRIDWPRGRSIRVVAEVLARTVVPEAADRSQLQRLIADLEMARYGPPGPADAEALTRMRAAVRRWSHLLAGSVSRRRRWTARVFPASVLSRGAVPLPATEPSPAESRR